MDWRNLASLGQHLAYNTEIVVIEKAEYWKDNPFNEVYRTVDWETLGQYLEFPVAFINHPVTGVTHLHEIPFEFTIWIEGLRQRQMTIREIPPSMVARLKNIGIIYNTPEVVLQNQTWTTHLGEQKQQLEKKKWALVKGIFDQEASHTIRNYLNRRRKDWQHGDPQSKDRIVTHNDPLFRFYHYQFEHRLGPSVMSEPVESSYCYLGWYQSGAELPRHVDRDQCRWNASVIMDSNPAIVSDLETWPIHVQIGSKTQEISAVLGDAIIYRGNEYPHWREKMPPRFKDIAVCFFHWVAPDFPGARI